MRHTAHRSIQQDACATGTGRITRLARYLQICATVGVLIAALPVAGLAQTAADADEATKPSAPSLKLELNALEAADTACRMTFVVENALGADLSSAAFEIAFFSRKGTVDRLTVLDFQDLPEGKTKVARFDLPATECDSIGRVLINTATACKGDGVDPKSCMRTLETDNRTEVTFGS